MQQAFRFNALDHAGTRYVWEHSLVVTLFAMYSHVEVDIFFLLRMGVF